MESRTNLWEFLQREAWAGLTTFLAISYIVIVNPSILATQGTGMDFSGVLTATVLVGFIGTLLMGLIARLPFAVAPGMGINAFFTFSLILGEGIPWQVALGLVFWSGVIFLFLSVTPIREKIALAIPQNLQIAAAAGIGGFLCLIGLKNGSLIVSDPVTLVKFGGLGAESTLCLLGIAITLTLVIKGNRLAYIVGIGVVTVASLALGLTGMPESYVSLPDFHSVVGKVDIWGALRLSFVGPIVTLLFTDLFDSLSTFLGVANANKLLDSRGKPLRLREGLFVDALATFFSALAGSSSGTTYVESTAGMQSGGRTGVTAVVTALCFLPCLFFAPTLGVIPSYATAPTLIVVGLLMYKNVTELDVRTLEDALPALVTITLIPLTFSITQGILWGFITHVALYAITGRAREINSLMYGLALVSALLLVL